MKCKSCGHEAEIYEFINHAIEILGQERWNEEGPTFLCPKCNSYSETRIQKMMMKG